MAHLGRLIESYIGFAALSLVLDESWPGVLGFQDGGHDNVGGSRALLTNL
jgi:hypothetical protein